MNGYRPDPMVAPAMTTSDGRGGTARPRARGRHLLESVTCPHCWHQFPPDEVLWIAKHDELRGDPVAGRDEPVRFRPTRFNIACEALDARGLPCQRLACPRCHLSVPAAFLESEPLIFSLIGAPRSGKSYLLAAMTRHLRRRLPVEFRLAFTDADVEGNWLLIKDEKTLFDPADGDKPVGLEKTDIAGNRYDQVTLDNQTVLLPRPCLFTLRPTTGHPGAEAVERLARVICLYDNAGEHFHPGRNTTTSPGTEHMARARVLMFLYDPTQDGHFRERCRTVSRDPQLSTRLEGWGQTEIMTETALRVKQHGGLPPHQKVERPLLVLVSKADIWSPLLEGDDVLAEPVVSPPVTGGTSALDISRVKRMSKAVRDLLLEVAPDLVAAAEDFCQRVIYMPVAPLGRSPEPPAGPGPLFVIRPRHISPRWVTVPFLYAFAKWSKGLVAAVRS